MGQAADLPTDDADMGTAFNSTMYTYVGEEDEGGYVTQETDTDKYAIFEFKDWVGDLTECYLKWVGWTDYPGTGATIYLQIYNRDSEEWENLDMVDTSPGLTVTLESAVLDLTDYTGDGFISCRVYQVTPGDFE